jgi:TetR/AcrR family transcriptional regulator
VKPRRSKKAPPANARERILDAAERAFAASGFDGARTRAIAQLARANVAQIHYYFDSKEGLYGAVLGRYFGQIGKQIERAAEVSGTPEERIRRIIGAHFDAMAKMPHLPRLMLDAVLRAPAAAREVARAAVRSIFDRLLPTLAESQLQGHVRAVPIPHAILSAVGMNVIYFAARPAVEQIFGAKAHSPAMLRTRREAVADLFLHGILSSKTRRRP